MTAIVESLAVNTGLEMLLIAENPFGDESGLAVLSTLCKGNTTLRVLDIHGSRMSIDTEKQVQTGRFVVITLPSHNHLLLCDS